MRMNNMRNVCVFSTSLMIAAANGHRGVCDYLISSGADVTLLDKLGTLSSYLSVQCPII